MKAMAVNCGHQAPDEDSLRFFYEALKRYTIEQVEAGVKKLLLKWAYNTRPTIYHLVKAIDPTPQIKAKAHVQADLILEHVKKYGAKEWPLLDDPITRHLMTTRWPYFTWASNITESESKWWHKEFVEAYEVYSESETIPQIEAPEKLKQLTGSIGRLT